MSDRAKIRWAVVLTAACVTAVGIGLCPRVSLGGAGEDELKEPIEPKKPTDFTGIGKDEKALEDAVKAIQAREFATALGLASRYLRQKPYRWQGYFIQGVALRGLKRYEEARKSLAKAIDMAPGQMGPAYELARAYMEPAVLKLREQFGARGGAVPTARAAAALKQVIGDLDKAGQVLADSTPLSDEARVDLLTTMGRNLERLALAYRLLAAVYEAQAKSGGDSLTRDRAARLVEQGQAARGQAGKALAKATELFRQAVRKDPKRASAVASLFRLARLTDHEEAMAEARRIIEAMETPPAEVQLVLIVDDLMSARDQKGDWRKKLAESAKTLDALLLTNPQNIVAKRLRAAIALMLEDLDKAERLSKEILGQDASNRYARLILARVKLLRGKAAEAEPILARLAAENPRWVEALVSYAQAARAVGKRDAALAAAQRALKLRPKNRTAQRLAMALGGRGAVTLEQVRKALDAKGDDTAALVRFVQLAQDRDKVDEARKKLQQTRKAFPQRLDVLWAVAVGYNMLGQKDKAREVSEELVKLKPTTSEGRIAAASALRLLDRPNEAEAILKEELAAKPDNAAAYYLLGRIHQQARRRMQAIERFRKAVGLAPAKPEYRLGLARALFETGDLEEAENVLEPVDPANEEAAVLRMQIAMAQGQSVDSAEMLAQAGKAGRSALILALTSLRARKVDQCIKICKAELAKAEGAEARSYRVLLAQAYLLKRQPAEAVSQLKEVLKADPSQLASYRMLARVLSRDRKPAEVREALGRIEGADENLIDLAVGGVLARQGKNKLAQVIFERVAERQSAAEDARSRARLMLAASLARDERLDDALEQLSRLRGKGRWHKQAVEAAAKLQIASNRSRDAAASLEELTRIGVDEGDTPLLHRAARLYLAMKEPDKAMAVTRKLRKLAPDDAESYLLQAEVFLAQDKPRQAVDAVQSAIGKDPGNFSLYVRLARLLDGQEKRAEALAVLDDLSKRGEAGRAAALAERGRMLASWGLHGPAAEALQEVARTALLRSPDLHLRLGRALAALGKKGEARTQLREIPDYARGYVAAQLILARLAETTDESLRILDALGRARPNEPAVLTEKLALLLRAERAAEAAKAVQAAIKADKPISAQAAALGVGALIKTDDPAAAAALCRRMAGRSRSPQWRQLAALLLMDNQPDEAARLVPSPAESSVHDAVLGLCRAVQRSGRAGREQARKWYGRLNELERAMASQRPPQRLPAALKMLASLASGAGGQAAGIAKQLASRGLAEQVAARELIDHAAKQPQAGASEASALLKVELAVALRVPQLARTWAMKVLHARPTCLWAAVAAIRAGADKQTQQQALRLVKPSDSLVAKAIRAGMLLADGEAAKAAELYAELAKALPDDPAMALRQAMAAERAGQADQAIALYEAALAKGPNPVAANNAAYLVALKFPKDTTKLAKAARWAKDALELAPAMSALHDTVGWIAHLQGRDADALPHLRRAVRADPDSIENHYHLGVVETAVGKARLGRWHLETAVALAKKAEGEGKPLSASAREAVRAAAGRLEGTGKATVRIGP